MSKDNKNHIKILKPFYISDRQQKGYYFDHKLSKALLHKDLKGKAPLIEPNLRRNLGKWST